MTSVDAAQIFAGFLARMDRGEIPDFDALLNEHPGHAEDLKRLFRDECSRLEGTGRDLSGSFLHQHLSPRSSDDLALPPDQRSTTAQEFAAKVIDQLSSYSSPFGRYTIQEEIGKGGMGAVMRVWDENMRRHLAMKVILGPSQALSRPGAAPLDPIKLARFLIEAQVTGELDHPGIVPVHELGLDPEGRVYFTMKLVEGRTLAEVLGFVRDGTDGWTQVKALNVIRKVCEAMAYAHDKGVIHRDLKPANVMVGRFGEAYVMDWGLARILGRDDPHNIRLQADRPSRESPARNDASEARDAKGERGRKGEEPRGSASHQRGATSDSPLYTLDGDVVGTPAYMPPEQALGQVDEIGPHSDVYALGAMLYHLIAGHMPYVPSDTRLDNYAIWGLVRQGPPTSIAQLSPETPAELVAICDKAMARDWKQRYRDMSGLAADLSAYLEHRVVGAYQTGAWAETKKWIERNKALAVSLAAAIVILVAGVIGTTTFAVDAKSEAKRADEKTAAEADARREAQRNERHAIQQERIATQRASDLVVATKTAQDNEKLAKEQREIATQKANDVLSLSAIQELKELVERADDLWPAFPEKIAEYDRWLGRAKVLIDGRAADPARGLERHPSLKDHEAKLMEIRQSAKAPTLARIEANQRADGARSEQVEEASELSADAAGLEHGVNERRTYEFDDAQARWWHAQLSQLVADLKAFTDEKTGLFSDGTSEQHGWGILKRRKEAATIDERSVSGEEAKRRWDEAIAAIAKSEKYGGLKLTTQLGLVPIGVDLESHLWEFAYVQTGDVPERGGDGRLTLKESMSLVFVLIPAGKFWMGAQKADVHGQNHDAGATSVESPVHEVSLDAFFLSKYEMTQGQWKWLTGLNPSQYGPGTRIGDGARTLLNPVEQVSWTECARLMFREGLALPTEAQWEYAARAGMETPWWTGEDVHSLDGAANLADIYCKNHGGPSSWMYEEWLDDGFAVHAPVGSFLANAFGLHDVIGNVWEWCRDLYGAYSLPMGKGDGERQVSGTSFHVYRGGSFSGAAPPARSANRPISTPELRYGTLGLRPAKGITH